MNEECLNDLDKMYGDLFSEKQLESTTLEDLKEYIKSLNKANEEYLKSKEETSLLYRRCEAIENSILRILEAHNLKKFSCEFGNIERRSRTSVKMPTDEGQRKAFLDYLKDKGMDNLITVNSQTLNSYIKTLVNDAEESGEELILPPGISAPSITYTLSLRKG